MGQTFKHMMGSTVIVGDKIHQVTKYRVVAPALHPLHQLQLRTPRLAPLGSVGTKGDREKQLRPWQEGRDGADNAILSVIRS